MYNILFHLCGVILLETCFFFFYIGPIETQMFKKKISDLLVDPVMYLTNHNNLSPTEQIVLINIFSQENNNNSIESIYEDLLHNSEQGKENRYNKNLILFKTAIEYWVVLLLVSVLTYLIHYYYYYKYKNTKPLTTIVYQSQSQLELNEMEGETYYRKGSIDDDELEDKSYEKLMKQKKLASYLGFAFLLILFKYLFFQFIVFNYNPLSLNEVKYIIYVEFKPLLDDFYSNNSSFIYTSLPTFPPFTIGN